MAYDYQPFTYAPPPGLTAPEPRHPVVIVGAGPVGLALAVDLAQHGLQVVVLDDNNVVSVGSRAICWAKRSLEILDRLGVGEAARDKGVTWQIGRTYHRDTEVFNFDLQPEDGDKMPAFVNLQQYYVEDLLVSRAMDLGVDLRWKNRVTGIAQGDHATLTIETPDGPYTLTAEWVVACDGARSPMRGMMGLAFDGELFEERFLIADIEMQADFPSERRFWFEPTFHNGQSALLHKQPDNIYRIDLQLGWDADPDVEKRPENVIPRIARVVGHDDFRLDWVSIYTFQCRRLERFVQGRVIFAGDAAHIVSPFGARGGNGGLQDVDALGWRLAHVVQGGPVTALDAYDAERQFASDENILNSSRSTRFMSPEPGIERLFRDAVLTLAAHADFARPMVNSGRLSRPCVYSMRDDAPDLPVGAKPGAVAPDAPIGNGWLSDATGGQFAVLCFGNSIVPEGIRMLKPEISDIIRTRYLGDAPSAVYLIRPDQVIAARWHDAAPAMIASAIDAARKGQA